MKCYVKYLISTVIFGLIYTLVEYLFTKNIEWKMVIVATIVYGIIYPIIDLACKRLILKKY